MDKLPTCTLDMEACSGAHRWARAFTKLGYEVRIMVSKFVIPYRQNEKNNAEAICEAARRPKTRFVSIKSQLLFVPLSDLLYFLYHNTLYIGTNKV